MFLKIQVFEERTVTIVKANSLNHEKMTENRTDSLAKHTIIAAERTNTNAKWSPMRQREQVWKRG